ncbi:hypothetical protein Bca4012_092596 [Brassica carinata]|uniref:(rape) hypothetical protein n=1 Tax=Brassica napus TaxID=3708 RepID=A0A816UBF0_BRANA|nr:unnamed protein product [Brassica napus]
MIPLLLSFVLAWVWSLAIFMCPIITTTLGCVPEEPCCAGVDEGTPEIKPCHRRRCCCLMPVVVLAVMRAKPT